MAGVILALMLTLPGWAYLALTGVGRGWPGLQRLSLAVGLSVAAYPVVFYGLRALAPGLALGPGHISAALAVCAGLGLWRGRPLAGERLAPLEWLAVAVIAGTLFTRFWILQAHPYPAWSDSLHHTLLTQLTAELGRLPATLAPYGPADLSQYHLGLYALTGSVQALTGLEAHSALLLTAQALNGLCGLGVYLVLDRKLGRWGAVVGLAAVGLWSFQPAWYVNWGRFTQLSSQTLMLIAWVVNWEALTPAAGAGRRQRAGWWVAAAGLNAALFLLHFRVAAFYLPLLAVTVLAEGWLAWRARRLRAMSVAAALIGLASLALIAPALAAALPVYLNATARLAASGAAGELQSFFTFSWAAVPVLVARPWLLALAAAGLGWGLWRRNGVAWAVAAWLFPLVGLGFTYLLGLPVLNITNLGAVLIMLYQPVALAVGLLGEGLWRLIPERWHGRAQPVLIIALLGVSVVTGRARATEAEAYRYFVTPADVRAMAWIRANTPAEAQFAINTIFWLPTLPHGTDAGYWIPYLTGRATNTDTMLSGFSPPEHLAWLVAASRAADQLSEDPAAVEALRALGVDYIYLGQQGDFSGGGLSAAELQSLPGLRPVYTDGAVAIFAILPGGAP